MKAADPELGRPGGIHFRSKDDDHSKQEWKRGHGVRCKLNKRRLAMYCVESGEMREVDAGYAELIGQAWPLRKRGWGRWLTLLCCVAAETWPCSLDAEPGWSRDRFREGVDVLSEPPAYSVA